ncbi:hypothetical protein [Mycoplasma mycoides]|uniref:hypothetical protein n=1 Tax=Mycoplasma mycoides TaxID=2102 RepID=UPI001ED96E45
MYSLIKTLSSSALEKILSLFAESSSDLFFKWFSFESLVLDSNFFSSFLELSSIVFFGFPNIS